MGHPMVKQICIYSVTYRRALYILRTIVEPCILTENGIYMMWSHIYICIKDKTAYMHVESCIYIIEL